MQFRNHPHVVSVLSRDDVPTASKSFDRDWIVSIIREELEIARDGIRKGGRGLIEREVDWWAGDRRCEG